MLLMDAVNGPTRGSGVAEFLLQDVFGAINSWFTRIWSGSLAYRFWSSQWMKLFMLLCPTLDIIGRDANTMQP